MSNDRLKCSFCGKTQDQVKKLIAGPDVFICDECVELCNEILDEEFFEGKDKQSEQKKGEVAETESDMSCGTFKRAEAQEPQMAMASVPQGVVNNDENDDLPF